MRREYADVEILPLEALRALPKCGELTGGIYFLWLEGDLKYIGKSRDLDNRLSFHERNPTIPFDEHTALVIDRGQLIEDPIGLSAQLKRLERAYIAHYEPPYNHLYANVGT